MAKGIYVGVSGVARKVKKGYVGVGGVARKIKKGYIGVGGTARLFYIQDIRESELVYTGSATSLMHRRYNMGTPNDLYGAPYTMFAGGATEANSYHQITDMAERYTAMGSKVTSSTLYHARECPAAGVVGLYIIFAGIANAEVGYLSSAVEAFDHSGLRTLLPGLPDPYPGKGVAAVGGGISNGFYVHTNMMVAGGSTSDTVSGNVVMYGFFLELSTLSPLNYPGKKVGSFVDNYAMFAGYDISADVYDVNGVKLSNLPLSNVIDQIHTASTSKIAFFLHDSNDIIDTYNENLTKTTISGHGVPQNDVKSVSLCQVQSGVKKRAVFVFDGIIREYTDLLTRADAALQGVDVRSGFSVASASNDKILIAGGKDRYSQYSNAVDLYTFANAIS